MPHEAQVISKSRRSCTSKGAENKELHDVDDLAGPSEGPVLFGSL